ncbi:MAG TPA: hypothetical protein VK325_01290 [Pseudoxanthomonas sp.]|nr:hypothetical protein [Pseudoxanthomonas sp.]
MKWIISYYWPTQAAAQEAIPEDEVTVMLNFWHDARYVDAPLKKPERTWIHLYRSVKPEEEFWSTTTSLTGVMLWDQFNNGNLSTKAVIPLDHLLAFGTGFDMLVWNIRTEPNQFGRTHVLAKDVIPIAAMRGKISEIPKLRRMLDKKAANSALNAIPR